MSEAELRVRAAPPAASDAADSTPDEKEPTPPAGATRTRRVPFADPATGEPLEAQGDALVDPRSGRPRARIVRGIPRFVEQDEDYAEAFGWQWHHWTDTLSDARNPGARKRELLEERFHLSQYPLRGASVLECGMGGGDDTEILLQLPFAQVHSFDLSRAVDRAAEFLDDPRLVLSQASITEIPYADASFDFVYCHRVLQHTPDPERSLRSIARKVKPGGVLFVHSYKKSFWALMNYKYKYRWLTRRLPHRWIYRFVESCGPRLHAVNAYCRNSNVLLRAFAYNFVPFQWMPGQDLDRSRLLELEKLVTFDALTPRFDKPMTSRRFRALLADEGFEIEHILDPRTSPICATARRV